MYKITFISILLMLMGCSRDADNPKNARFNSNGCLECQRYDKGDMFQINGETYIVASYQTLRASVRNNSDLSHYCTSKISNMSGLFEGVNPNGDISSWDVGNVTDMSYMFANNTFFNQDI